VNSSEGRRLTSLISEDMLYPVIIFSFNKRENNVFNRGSIIDRLEGHITLDNFRDALIRNIELKDNMKKGVSTTASLIEQQKQEIEYLERLENEKKQREIEERIKAEKELEEQKRKELERESLKMQKLNSLPPEPETENPDSTFIIFRYPDGYRRAERRFLKSDPIKVN
jgi:hypothetical protein